jgi:predicted glycoside hydrolase/deacetylase ChbG (UPF0249 family)
VIIVNADDFGRTRVETDTIIRCYAAGRISSTTAMVFMEDSERAAERAREVALDFGLHLNLVQRFTGHVGAGRLRECQDRVVGYLTSTRYTHVLYNPALRQEFRYIYQAQYEEFVRLYGRHPSHVDGHQHKHLCANILLGGVIPPAVKIRRNFSFWPGEKSLLNRGYRKLVDRWLARRYTMTDFFFSLQQSLQRDRLARVFDLAHAATVELMTHPVNQGELAYLMSDACAASLSQIRVGTYAEL